MCLNQWDLVLKYKMPISLLLILGSLCGGCASEPFLTIPIYESPNKVIRLQTFPDTDLDRGFSHPAFPTKGQVTQVLQGVFIEESATALSFLGGGSKVIQKRAFSEAEVEFLTPLFVKGLGTATPRELVTFFGSADVSKTHRRIKSGGVFVQDGAFHVVLSNVGAKVPIWQDTDEYQAPYRLQPLEPIDPEQGELVFEHKRDAIRLVSSSLPKIVRDQNLHVAVLLQGLKTDNPSFPSKP